MDNLEEMDRFWEKFNLPRLNQEEKNHEQTNYKYWNWNGDKKISPQKQKSRARWLHRGILPNI